MRTSFPAKTALLEAAEGSGRVRHQSEIQPDHSAFQLLADAQRTPDICGEDIGYQPILGLVGPLDHFVLGIEHANRRDRSKNLFVVDARCRWDRRQDGREVEVTRHIRTFAADEHFGSFSDRTEKERVTALKQIEQSAEFKWLQRNALRTLYDDPELWAGCGYEGVEGCEDSGVRSGINDLDWLPEPVLTEGEESEA